MNNNDTYSAESHKDPAQLEREIDQKRNHIEGIVKALENKLTPGEIFEEVLQMGKGGSRQMAGSLASTIKANPMPSLVTAVGLLWLYSSSRNSGSPIVTSGVGINTAATSSTTTYATDTSTTTLSTDQGYGSGQNYNAGQNYGAGHSSGPGLRESASQKLGSAKDAVGSKLGSAKETVSQKTSAAADTVKQRASQASDGFSRMLDENPMAVGAIGIAVGALLGAIIPKTRKEDEWLGEHSDRITGQIKDVAKRGYEQVSTATREIAGSSGSTGMQQDRSLSSTGTGSSSAGLSSSSPTAH